MQDENKDKIEHLRDLLYSPNSPEKINAHRRKLGTQEYSVQQDWQSDSIPKDESKEIPENYAKKKSKNLGLLIIFALVFFLVCAGIAAYVYLTGFNTISSGKVDITFNAPISSPSGEPLAVTMSITNKNNESLTLTDAIINYPDGSRQSENVALPLTKDLFSIGTILPGQTIQKQYVFTPFGEQNSVKDVKVTLQYHIGESTAVFEKTKNYEVSLSSPPVSITIDALKEVNTNQEYNLTIHLTSNSLTVLKNLLVSVKYPFGFAYSTSNPRPISSSSQSLWNIGDLEPQGKRDILIKGIMTGSDMDQRAFNISLGIADKEGAQKIGTVFLTKSQSVNIRRPFLTSSILIENSANQNYAAPIGKNISGTVSWKNNLTTAVNDSNFVLNFNGDFFDKSKIVSSNGFYDSESNSIIWNKLTNPELAQIPAGQSGQLGFSFVLIGDNPQIDATVENPTSRLALNVSGTRLSESNVPQTITSTDNKTIKISSSFRFFAENIYSSGPFKNTGPVPPVVGAKTSYTIEWKLTNTFNDLKNVTVKATLPLYVSWLNNISPTDENVTYNPNTHVVTWKIANLPHSTGFGKVPPKILYFQLGISPSLGQKGSSPILVDQMQAEATDSFTEQLFTENVQSLNTTLINDPLHVQSSGVVNE